jgi:hypothetical protein
MVSQLWSALEKRFDDHIELLVGVLFLDGRSVDWLLFGWGSCCCWEGNRIGGFCLIVYGLLLVRYGGCRFWLLYNRL